MLKRDAELAALRRQLALRPVVDAAAEASIQQALQQELTALDEDRDFACREPGVEAMSPADQQRVRDMGRNANGAIRRAYKPVSDGGRGGEPHHPVGHVDPGRARHHQPPHRRHQPDAGDLALAAPPLKNVPEYAGGHHERMDGRGYPKGSRASRCPRRQARMIGVADVFEALTAADRPYKSGMSLSQALDIMVKMRNGGHIDPDLFDVFVSQGCLNATRESSWTSTDRPLTVLPRLATVSGSAPEATAQNACMAAVGVRDCRWVSQ